MRQLPVLDNYFRMPRNLTRIRVIVIGVVVTAIFLMTPEKIYHHQREESKDVRKDQCSDRKYANQIIDLSHSHGKEIAEITATESLERNVKDLRENLGHVKLGSSLPPFKIYIYEVSGQLPPRHPPPGQPPPDIHPPDIHPPRTITPLGQLPL